MKNTMLVPPSSTLLELLEERAAFRSEAPLFHFVEDTDGEESTLPYSGLLNRARSIGACLQQFTSPGERAVLLYPPGLEYVSGFFGCLASGVVAVPDGWGPQIEGAKDMNVTADIFIGCLLVLCLIGGWIAGGQR